MGSDHGLGGPIATGCGPILCAGVVHKPQPALLLEKRCAPMSAQLDGL